MNTTHPLVKPIVLIAGILVALYLVGAFLAPKNTPTEPQPTPDASTQQSADTSARKERFSNASTEGLAKLGPKAVTTKSGLRYEDITVGSGKEAKKGTSVDVHYTGWLTDGTKFDSSKDRNEPFNLSLPGQVIEGWNEGIPGMKEGGKRKLVIPAALGYGEAGAPPTIPAGATLVFEVELLKVK